MHNITKLQYHAALSLDLPCDYFENTHVIHVTLGRRQYVFNSGSTPFNSAAVAEKVSNKFDMNQQLSQAGFPVPKAMTLFPEDMPSGNLESIDLNFPVVIKPTVNIFGGGKDVTCNISNIDQLSKIACELFQTYNQLSIEEFLLYPKAYRVLILFNKVIGVVERTPAQVCGDGIHSIKQLISMANKIREKQALHVTMSSIRIDDETHIKLKELNLTLDCVPKKDQIITLCYGCNSGRGGSIKSLVDAICPENARLLCAAARELNLNFVGFDFLCHDIMSPISETGGVIIEANHNPDCTLHENPLEGTPCRVNRIIMRKIIKKHPILYWRYRTNSNANTIIRCVKIALVFLLVSMPYYLQLHS